MFITIRIGSSHWSGLVSYKSQLLLNCLTWLTTDCKHFISDNRLELSHRLPLVCYWPHVLCSFGMGPVGARLARARAKFGVGASGGSRVVAGCVGDTCIQTDGGWSRGIGHVFVGRFLFVLTAEVVSVYWSFSV